MPFSRDTILSFSLNRRVLGQNGPHQANHSKPWEHQKQNCGQSVLGIYVQMDRIEELPRTFHLGGCILYYIQPRRRSSHFLFWPNKPRNFTSRTYRPQEMRFCSALSKLDSHAHQSIQLELLPHKRDITQSFMGRTDNNYH